MPTVVCPACGTQASLYFDDADAWHCPGCGVEVDRLETWLHNHGIGDKKP